MARDVIDDRLIGALHLEALTKNGFAHLAHEERGVFQIGTLDALLHGHFDGDTTLGELLKHGSMGLGTVQELGGELIVLDGTPYVARVDGTLEELPRSTKTPFAVVVEFNPHDEFAIAPMDFSDFVAVVDRSTPDLDAIVAFRLDGTCSGLTLRSVPAQSPPYRPLSEVVHDQREWTCELAKGTLVGFRFPDATAGVEVPGFHVHFIAKDRCSGGHVVSIASVQGTLSVDSSSTLHLELPDGVGLGQPGVADRAAIRAVEGGGGR